MNRQIAFKALVGSHNYNLNTPESDKDYKVFVIPTFDDLYHNKQYSNSVIGEEADYDYHDIRKLVNLFWKSNVNFIEVLYSKDIILSGESWIDGYIKSIFEQKESLVRMNLPYLYRACKGMYFNKIKYLDKGTEGTKHLVEKYGYDTKQALHAFRILDFIERFAETDFNDFQYAMTYNDNERDNMLVIKDGLYSRNEYIEMVNNQFDRFEKLEDLYLSQKEDIELKEKLEQVIYDLVRMNIRGV